MSSSLTRILSGSLIGLCLSLLIWVIIFEHITFYIILPIFPIIGLLLGALIGYIKIIPEFKLLKLILLLTILITSSFVFDYVRETAMSSIRINFAQSISSQYPQAKITHEYYNDGNGMEIPPSVQLTIESNDNYQDIINFYDKWFLENDWKSRHPWKKDNFQIFLRKYEDGITRNKTIFKVEIDFLGNWLTHFKQ